MGFQRTVSALCLVAWERRAAKNKNSLTDLPSIKPHWHCSLGQVVKRHLFSFPHSDSGVQSHQKDGDGRPLLRLCPPAVYVRSFGQLSMLVQLAGDRKLDEVRACLEGKSHLHQERFESDFFFNYLFQIKTKSLSYISWRSTIIQQQQHTFITHRPDLFFLPVNPRNNSVMVPVVYF